MKHRVHKMSECRFRVQTVHANYDTELTWWSITLNLKESGEEGKTLLLFVVFFSYVYIFFQFSVFAVKWQKKIWKHWEHNHAKWKLVTINHLDFSNISIDKVILTQKKKKYFPRAALCCKLVIGIQMIWLCFKNNKSPNSTW